MNASAQRGMTIVEILVAIAIVAIVMALAGPSSLTWIQNLQIRNSGESVMNGLKTARLEALRRNTSVMFELTDVNSTAWHVCLFDTVTLACQASQADLAFKPASEASPNARVGVEQNFTSFATPLDAGTGFPAQVVFDPLGRVSTVILGIARVDVRNPNMASSERRLSIMVGPAGQIYMCDPNVPKSTNPQGCV